MKIVCASYDMSEFRMKWQLNFQPICNVRPNIHGIVTRRRNVNIFYILCERLFRLCQFRIFWHFIFPKLMANVYNTFLYLFECRVCSVHRNGLCFFLLFLFCVVSCDMQLTYLVVDSLYFCRSICLFLSIKCRTMCFLKKKKKTHSIQNSPRFYNGNRIRYWLLILANRLYECRNNKQIKKEQPTVS